MGDTSERGRCVLMHADQAVRLGLGVELQIFPKVEQPPAFDFTA